MDSVELNITGLKLVVAIMKMDGRFWVALKPLCEAIGIATNKQIGRVQGDPRFSWYQLVSTGSDGKSYQMICIPLDQVGSFLFTVNSRSSQKPEVRERLLAFQRDLQHVINKAVLGSAITVQESNAIKEHIQKLQEYILRQDEKIYQLEQELARHDRLENEEVSHSATMMARKRWDKERLAN